LQQAVVLIAGADPAGTNVESAAALQKAGFRVALSLFMNTTTALADVILPRQSVAERDGTFTNGERRVQRFYTAQGTVGESRPDWKIFMELHRHRDPRYTAKVAAGAVMLEITKNVPAYAAMTYKNLAQVPRQFPDVGGDDLYYGGTAYSNKGGIGVQAAALAEDPNFTPSFFPVKSDSSNKSKELLAVPIQRLYDRAPEFYASTMMHQRIPAPYAELNQKDASKLKIKDGDTITLAFGEQRVQVLARVNGAAPEGTVLLPRNLNAAPIPAAPAAVTVEK
jgi:NADH-quinone oxidoreductase subunit G